MSGKHVNLQQPAVCVAEEKREMLGFHPSLSHQGSCEKSELVNGDGGEEGAGVARGRSSSEGLLYLGNWNLWYAQNS